MEIETFFSDYANCEIAELPDDDLLEIAELMLQGFYVEILEMNDGAYYLLQIHAHQHPCWNCCDEHPQTWQLDREKTSIYQFWKKEAVLEAFFAFQKAAI